MLELGVTTLAWIADSWGMNGLYTSAKLGANYFSIQPNLKYRATTDNVLEKQSVKEAFAESVLFGFPIVETHLDHYLIEITPFLMQDTHGVSQRLKRSKQGNYKLDKSRSAVSLDRTKAFPKNIELDVLLTFAGASIREMDSFGYSFF